MRILPLLIFLVLPVFFASVSGEVTYAQELSQTDHQSHALDVILLIDSSPSMEGSDPTDMRITAARFLVDYLEAISQVAERNYRVGIANFGANLGWTLPLRSLSGLNRDAIVAEKIAFTDFRPALDFAGKEFAEKSYDAEPPRQLAIIIFTDGEPELSLQERDDVSAELKATYQAKYFEGIPISYDESDLRLPDLINDLQSQNVSLFVVGLGEAHESAAQWRTLLKSPERFFELDNPSSLPVIYHSIVTQLSDVSPARDEKITDQGAQGELEPYLQQAVFSFVKENPLVNIIFYDTQGTERGPTFGGEDDIYEIYLVAPPPPGGPNTWQVTLEGGVAQMWVDRKLPNLQFLESPSGSYALGDSLTLRAQLSSHSGTVIDDALDVYLEREGTDTSTHLTSIGNGVFETTIEVQTEGKHTYTLSAELRGEPLPVVSESALLTFYPVPTIESIDITSNRQKGKDVIVAVRIANADRLGDVGSFGLFAIVEGDDQYAYSLVDNGQTGDVKAGDGIFTTNFSWPNVGTDGEIIVNMSGYSRDGVLFRSRMHQVLPLLSPIRTIRVLIPEPSTQPTANVIESNPVATPSIEEGVNRDGVPFRIAVPGIAFTTLILATLVFAVLAYIGKMPFSPDYNIETSNLTAARRIYQIKEKSYNMLLSVPLLGKLTDNWVDNKKRKANQDWNEKLRVFMDSLENDRVHDRVTAQLICDHLKSFRKHKADVYLDEVEKILSYRRSVARYAVNEEINELLASQPPDSRVDLEANLVRRGILWRLASSTYKESTAVDR